jgi:murein DD-endopeptidase MepM/ murein hydrolase activator NlpD
VASRKITFIVMHSQRSEPKTFSISKRFLVLAAALLLVFMGFSVFSGLRAFTEAVSSSKLTGLEGENALLRAEIAELNGKVSDFVAAMAEHAEFEEHMRILADLEPMDEGIWGVGVGGPEIGSSAGLDGPVGDRLTSLNQDIDRLLRQVRLQRHSYGEILERLKEKSEELTHIPSIRPVDVGYISSGFGRRRDPFTGRFSQHEGLDFSARKGSNIYATADGTVRKAKYDRGYGYTIEIDHGNGIVTKYAHNQKLLVRSGQKVQRGDVIAYLGDSGRSTAPHLHYEVQVNGVPQNPLKFILPSDIVVD